MSASPRRLPLGDGRAAADGLDVRRELLGLLLVELGGPCAPASAPWPVERHPAGADLEVDRRAADADQRRAAVRDALQVRAVAGDAADLVQLLAGGDVCGLLGRVGAPRRAANAA